MKLLAGRKRDIADITELVKAGVDDSAVLDYLTRHAPDRLEEIEAMPKRSLATFWRK